MSIVLLGGGHVHAIMLRDWINNPKLRPAGKITLISQYTTTAYSGLLTGVLQKRVPEAEMAIPVQELCQRIGVDFILDVAIGLDLRAREIYLGFRSHQNFSFLSINCGGYQSFLSPKSYRTWLAKADLDLHHPLHIVGAGVTGIETALALRARYPIRDITIWEKNKEILPHINLTIRNKLKETLTEMNIDLNYAELPTSVKGLVLTTTGSKLPRWLRASGLQLTKDGYLAISPQLKTSDSAIFASGDVAQIEQTPFPRAGVYAVREAPILTHNLLAATTGRSNELKVYQPQSRHLILMPIDQKRAFALYGKYGWGPSEYLLRWKDKIDSKFVQSFEKVIQ